WLADGVKEVYEYDIYGRAVGIEVIGTGGNMMSEFTYIYDEAGRTVQEEFLSISSDGVATMRLSEYSYDALGRLVDATVSVDGALESAISYGYDLSGNRVLVEDHVSGST